MKKATSTTRHNARTVFVFKVSKEKAANASNTIDPTTVTVLTPKTGSLVC